MLRRFIFCLVIFAAWSAHAGAWLQADGQGLFIAQARSYTSKRFFDANGQQQTQDRYRKYEIQPYVEYGATDWLTVGGTAFVQQLSQSGDSNLSLADPELLARTLLWRDETQVVSLQPLIKFSSHFRDENAPRGGSSTTDGELSLLYGRNIALLSNRDYLDSRIGYRVRNNGRSPEWRNDVALGVQLTDTLQIIPAVRSVMATDMEEAPAFSQNRDLDSTYVTAELAGLYQLDATQSAQAAFTRTVYGIQSGDGYALSLGYARRF